MSMKRKTIKLTNEKWRNLCPYMEQVLRPHCVRNIVHVCMLRTCVGNDITIQWSNRDDSLKLSMHLARVVKFPAILMAIAMAASCHWNHLRAFWSTYSFRIFDVLVSWKPRQSSFLPFVVSVAVDWIRTAERWNNFWGINSTLFRPIGTQCKYEISRTMKKRSKRAL